MDVGFLFISPDTTREERLNNIVVVIVTNKYYNRTSGEQQSNLSTKKIISYLTAEYNSKRI